MNRKLHNSISALMAAGGALVLGLVIALPAPSAPAGQFAAAQSRPLELDLGLVQARVRFDSAYVERARARSGDLARVAGRIGARAEQLERDGAALAFATGMAGEVADLAAIASTLESPAAAEPASTESKRKAGKAARRNRRNLVMPYFSFLPRG
ncbi:hypothetical protein K4L06_18570 [Lysobacter sp. BMK333-48F3]|uniref:hypothetical protein n=1 Tax=Lysobacter sp. BMK333-48F3 TaxID=2867962 RepID=UPI001C8CCD50|nr:hypothetical protein [Lysobacter sp. BMK333-48F3]MBX9403321.1 hypothetical protein [Lysobacter sp. BMK333-48F3]